MRKPILALAASLAAACAPSLDPQMKSATDSMVASFKASHRVAEPASYEPMPWAVGQWVVMRVVDRKGEPSVVKVSVVGEENGGFWVETETRSYYQHSVNKVLYARVPRSADDAVDAMRWVITWTEGQERREFDFTVDHPGSAVAKGLVKAFAQGTYVPAVAAVAGAAKEDASVAAGSFRGCAKMRLKTVFGPIAKEGLRWVHPAVPLHGEVKSVSDDGEWTVELLDFGTTGAKSAL